MDHHHHHTHHNQLHLHLSADLYFHENPNFPNSSNNSIFQDADDHTTFMVVQEASINSNSTSSSSNLPGGSSFFYDPFDPFFPRHHNHSNNNNDLDQYFPPTLFAPQNPNPLPPPPPPPPFVNGFNTPHTYFQPLMDLQMMRTSGGATADHHVVKDSSSCCFNDFLLDHQKIMNANNNNNSNNNDVVIGCKISKNNNKAKDHQTAKRKRFVDKESEIIKGQWTSEEDRLLVESVEKHGVRKWSTIAKLLPGRIGKQCRERWHNHLKPNIKKDRWSEEEDRILIEAHRQLGNRWARIADKLPGRSENTIKNHWNATKRRQLSSRARNNTATSSSKSSSSTTSTTTTTPLQEYIKSLILHPNSDKATGNNNNNSSSSSYLDKYYSSSGCTSPADNNIGAISTTHVDNCSKLKPENDENTFISVDEEEERLETIMAQTDLMDSQMNMNAGLELQKEMDFMEMLSFGYI